MNFHYQILFILNFIICIIVMKLLSWNFNKRHRSTSFFSFVFATPYLSVRSEKRLVGPGPFPLFIKFFIFLIASLIMVLFAREFLQPLTYWKVILVSPLIYFMTEALGAFAQLLFIWNGKNTFPLHDAPLTSLHLSQFWGSRWNLWVQDWFKDITESLSKQKRIIKILTIFLASGFFHEVMVNLPYWLMTGKSYFGTMMAYFLIQALGIYVDKKILCHFPPLLRRIIMWPIVILPSPLFIGPPLLSFFGMT